MITEDYVSFETAKLLKEKGFNERCECFYETENDDVSIVNEWMDISNSELEGTEFVRYSAPTLQMVMKWLRKIHGLFIHIDVIREASCWTADIQDIKNDVAIYPVKEEFPGYEEACEAGIKYCLKNLI